MKTLSYNLKSSTLENTMLGDLKKIQPHLVISFFSGSFREENNLLEKLSTELPGTIIMGCSTSGEITNDGMSDNSISLLAIHFDSTKIQAAHAEILTDTDSSKAGEEIAQKLAAPDLAGVFVLCPGVNINGSEFVNGTIKVLGKKIPISGGLAGDALDFKQTFTFLNGKLYKNHAVAVGFYGQKICFDTGSRGGWSTFGPARRVTRSKNNILFELDGESALKLYKQYLGDKAEDLPSSGLLYPFAILQEDHSEQGLIRTILNVNHEEGSLILAGDLPEGNLVCLMHADIDNLIDGARIAASEAKKRDDNEESAAILVSCVGRKIVMTEDAIEEIDAVRNTFGPKVAMSGFYSYGEICPLLSSEKAELHNQTMTVTHISEKP